MTGLPMGDWADFNGFGIGGGVSGEYMISDNIGLGLNVGFMSFSGKTETIDLPFIGSTEVEYPSATMIPIQLMGNYHFMPGEDFNFYAGLGLGFHLLDIDGVSANGLGIAPRVGLNYMFSDELGLDFNTGYTILNATADGADESSDFSYIPINIGVIYVLD